MSTSSPSIWVWVEQVCQPLHAVHSHEKVSSIKMNEHPATCALLHLLPYEDEAGSSWMECFIGCFKEWEGGNIEKICTSSFFVQLKWCLMTAHKNLTLALCQALWLLSNLHINIVPSFGDMGALGIDLCRRSRLRWPHGDGLHASGLADGRDVQPPCWPHAVVLLRHRPRERLHHAAVGVAHSPWASSPPAPDLATGGPDLPHTTPAACSRVRRAPLGLLRAPSRRHERL
uniref:Uncharacterized protein n=1 Tax=Oryza nivara TaxID=4536 RepID=A0A0E0FUF1_ORYNI